MKILLVTQYYWPENFLINDLVLLLLKRGIQVTVLTGRPNYPDGRVFRGYEASGLQTEWSRGVLIYRLPIIPRGRRSAFKLMLNYLSFIAMGWYMGKRSVKYVDYDLVFVYAPSPLLQALPAIGLARSRRVPLVVWVQDLWPESLSATGYIKNRWLLGLVARLVRRIYRASDRILVQSRAFVPPVAALTDDPAKIAYYPNLYQPVEPEKIDASARALANEMAAYFSVVFAGNLGSAQSLDTIVEAARLLLPHLDIRIVLVGSGSLSDWLAEQVAEHGLTNLILTGRFEASQMPLFFQTAHALLVSLKPDPTFGMTVPSKVQAYLAAGRPILAALDGEGAKIIQEAGAGLCGPAGDARALADNILRLRDMPAQERAQMGQQAKAYFEEHFAPDALADKLAEHFSQLHARKADNT